MYDPSSEFQKQLNDQREKGGYEEWRKGKPQPSPIENAITWIVFIGLALLIIIFLTQAFGS